MKNMLYPVTDLDIRDNFWFLVKQYKMTYAYQTFAFGRGWVTSEHSFYNEFGCFTISSLPPRGETDFYRSIKFSNNRAELHEKIIDVFLIEKEIWAKYKRVGFLPIPFPLFRHKRFMKAVSKVIQTNVQKEGTLLGIEIKK